ncbi:ORF2 [Wawtorquevirus murid3]|uniref:ORF2 n=1 Tax=Rodent Torque teno virus 2 TaxID=1514665 RepID=A0A0A7RB83_9VIRU|nr:ORF2 [Rodent Torque teno virus 2]AJA32102.1 ORF2 [Rodent Torque teno virus 2]
MPESIELVDLGFKRKEAEFRRLVSSAHKLFCSCSDPASHLRGWRSSTGGDTTDQGEPTTGGGEPTTGEGDHTTGEGDGR